MKLLTPPRAVSWFLLLSRLSILVVAIIWFSSADILKFTVALASLALTFLPSRIIAHAAIAEKTSLATVALLSAHIVFGMYLGFYETSIWYDKIVHLFGSAAVALVLLVAINAYSNLWQLSMPKIVAPVLVVIGTVCAGTFWEFFEYGIDSTGLFQAQRGLDDTMQDLFADALGAILAITFLTARNVLKGVVEKPGFFLVAVANLRRMSE